MGAKKERSPYRTLIHDRYYAEVYPDGKRPVSYESGCNYGAVIAGPAAYQVEDEMLEFVENHKDASLREILDYFLLITPDGLPPGDDGSDLLDE